MSWRDRPYAGDGDEPELRIQFRRPGTAVTTIIVANCVIFLLDVLLRNNGIFLERTLGLSLDGIRSLCFWQLFTYMFMHDDVWHLLVNMLGLYIFGSEFERHFGRQRFLQFYATCGLVGGLAYLVWGMISPGYAGVPLVGASGAVYGLLMAGIIFFPHLQVVLIIFPMPIRVFGLIIAAVMVLQLISGSFTNPGGQVCHMAGAATAILVFYGWGIMPRIRMGFGRGWTVLPGSGSGVPRGQGAWARKQKQLAAEQAEVDRILQKVHDSGLGSLTRSERKTLSRATQRQREREDELHRVDRL
jgi:membrane associated rhomboid family serine protease